MPLDGHPHFGEQFIDFVTGGRLVEPKILQGPDRERFHPGQLLGEVPRQVAIGTGVSIRVRDLILGDVLVK